MDITLTATRVQANKQLAGFRRLTVGALIGIAIMLVYLQAALIGQITMPLPIFSVISLVIASLVAGRPVGGWRWTPILAVVWSVVLPLGDLDKIRFELAHPENTHQFAWQLVILSLLVVAVVGGVGATIQSYRRPAAEQRLPRWVAWAFTALAGGLLGAIVVAAIPQAGSGAQVSPAALAQLPAVTLDAYQGGEIRVTAGELTGLRLQNPAGVGHSFDVDELNVHVAMASGGESLALFRAATPGTYTFYCAPHYDKATGKGMHGTLIVEP